VSSTDGMILRYIADDKVTGFGPAITGADEWALGGMKGRASRAEGAAI